jgi:hypothetical protein
MDSPYSPQLGLQSYDCWVGPGMPRTLGSFSKMFWSGGAAMCPPLAHVDWVPSAAGHAVRVKGPGRWPQSPSLCLTEGKS